MRYGSVCSGIECASVAVEPLGWTPQFFAEIDRFPCAVLAHHYGSNLPGEPLSMNGVPNFGDMNDFQEWPDADIDVLVGGTPCQAYSVAGLRKGLDDPRGELSLVYAAVARRYRPRWLVWENVAGVLSHDGGRSFASILGLLAGVRVEVPQNGWKSAGYVVGYEGAYGLAWRVIDAQYIRVDGFGRAVPQRRRRVIVVGHSGGAWQRAAAVLLERESLSGNPAPRRSAREGTAADAQVGFGGGRHITDVASTLDSHFGDKQGLENQHVNQGCPLFVAHSLRAEGFDASEDGTGRGTPIVPIPFDTTQITSAANYSKPKAGDPCHTPKGGAHPPAVAFQERERSGGRSLEIGGDVSYALLSPGGGSRAQERNICQGWAVRRLTPLECERLMGLPDGYTAITHRGRSAADGPRYRALGNGFTVNFMRWVSRRIEMVDGFSFFLSEAAE
ncbi:DNA cytosine methyltransferase [Jiella marina]|uniref:DNA cytosine methyltransferase n=1 Tax=Jiella sp. LLJ827 TaxID=2917712 RepID=UPI00210166F4|nr:DNA cytosine methyltransferase [Jiella sp. LLJ827]MCQ0986420.1 DNA cytosine methyltransferase [Jiella sp. LLJ827]